IVQPPIIGAYPDQGIVEPEIHQEINFTEENLEEINLDGILDVLTEAQEGVNFQEGLEEEKVHSEPESEGTIENEESEPEINMGDQALQDAAQAINALAAALGQGGEKSLIKIDFYHGDGTQDPVTWVEEFERAAKANHWSPARQLELAAAYMKDNAQEWFSSLANAPTHFHHNRHGQNVNGVNIYSFTHLFKEKFSTTKQKAAWQKQLFEIKQGTDTVDTYVSRFKQLKGHVDPLNNFPAAVMIQFFIQGLRPEYAMNVQAAEPANLGAAITEARKWETGRMMASEHNANNTNQAIERLTEQIAKLSINLAEKQAAPPTTTSVYYTDQNKDRPQSNAGNATCYYCGQKGHFIWNCHTRYQDNRKDYQGYQSRGRSNPDPETEANLGIEIIIVLDMIDPGAEASL
ncbi:9644_t:CDS:2, partial [Paraglomus brasilianum]